jgi:hypothetical protein
VPFPVPVFYRLEGKLKRETPSGSIQTGSINHRQNRSIGNRVHSQFRGSIAHPTQLLCTLRGRRCRRLTQHLPPGGSLGLPGSDFHRRDCTRFGWRLQKHAQSATGFANSNNDGALPSCHYLLPKALSNYSGLADQESNGFLFRMTMSNRVAVSNPRPLWLRLRVPACDTSWRSVAAPRRPRRAFHSQRGFAQRVVRSPRRLRRDPAWT